LQTKKQRRKQGTSSDEEYEDDASIDVDEFLDSEDDDYIQPIPKKKVRGHASGSLGSSRRTRIAFPIAKADLTHSQGRLPTPKKRRRPKPADMPRRPLSAYNIFFQEQRALIIGHPVKATVLSTAHDTATDDPQGTTGQFEGGASFVRKKRAHRKTHGKISFADLAKRIGQKWTELPAKNRAIYEAGAGKIGGCPSSRGL